MKPHEIFTILPQSLASQLFDFIHKQEKPIYKAMIESLAKQRRLRPVFIERKPRDARHVWLKDALSRKASDGIAAHLLQIWFVGEHKDLLCDFLDALGIEHDENGTVDALPEAPTKEKLETAITTLLAKHDRELVAAYLYTFQALDDSGGWPTLAEILTNDERLKIGEPTAAK